MKGNGPANLHKVEPIAAVNINAMVLLMGSIAIMLLVEILFNFMMDDFNLLLIILLRVWVVLFIFWEKILKLENHSLVIVLHGFPMI